MLERRSGECWKKGNWTSGEKGNEKKRKTKKPQEGRRQRRQRHPRTASASKQVPGFLLSEQERWHSEKPEWRPPDQPRQGHVIRQVDVT